MTGPPDTIRAPTPPPLILPHATLTCFLCLPLTRQVPRQITVVGYEYWLILVEPSVGSDWCGMSNQWIAQQYLSTHTHSTTHQQPLTSQILGSTWERSFYITSKITCVELGLKWLVIAQWTMYAIGIQLAHFTNNQVDWRVNPLGLILYWIWWAVGLPWLRATWSS